MKRTFLIVAANRRPKASPPHDFAGAAALAFAVGSAGATATAIHHWRDVGQYRASLPAYATEGAAGFSLHFLPSLLTLCSMGVGFVAVILLAVSLIMRRSKRLPRFTLLHTCTVVALLPLLYLVGGFAAAIFR